MKKKDPSKALEDSLHEKFCRSYAGICRETGIKAYVEASGEELSEEDAAMNACRLLKKIEIRERIDYLREEFVKSRNSWIICRLAEISEKAEKDSDRIRALVCLQKIFGSEDAETDSSASPDITVSFEGRPEE